MVSPGLARTLFHFIYLIISLTHCTLIDSQPPPPTAADWERGGGTAGDSSSYGGCGGCSPLCLPNHTLVCLWERAGTGQPVSTVPPSPSLHLTSLSAYPTFPLPSLLTSYPRSSKREDMAVCAYS